jgi:hypothetical protein
MGWVEIKAKRPVTWLPLNSSEVPDAATYCPVEDERIGRWPAQKRERPGIEKKVGSFKGTDP